ncbi:glucan biosynthesis protein [Nitratireductor sp. ZSWI3]|uniref:glucan biosynthesis protein n=1 Tax=Nitratireductor sp. ZSWI3 TaxID=2966359 RepID=UPI00214F9E4C|nr:glucan biosynthesis protein D [Nitratireductor sp. ZSWI3]MCR4269123.1 glucan biosynthesis protein D [Nitratireductor sp. ZSWI3]
MTDRPTRRAVLATGLAAGAFSLLPAIGRAAAEGTIDLGPPEPFSFAAVKRMAEELAGSHYAPQPVAGEDILEEIDYDLHNQITYRPERTLWRDAQEGPAVRFFHPGRYFKQPVDIWVVEDGKARHLDFRQDYFDMPEDHPARDLQSAGFAGFRVMNGDQKNDWMAFLGGTYFRTSGPFDQFGLSARGIVVDAAAARGPEEFPRFTRFWLERANHGGIIIHALMNGPSVAGAYRIESRRDEGIVQDVEATIILREDVERLGIAPLTSMFWYGENNRQVAKDWRPEIHDSDGLEIWTGEGERIWRPIANPPRTMVNAFADNNPRGFGLMQRDRDFENYQDDGVFYEKRASLWVEPLQGWGEGSVELLEIPTDDEIHDNIGAFWVPAGTPRAGDRHDMHYRLHWVADTPGRGFETARVVATRTGLGGVPGQPRPPGATKFAVDLEGPVLDGLDRDSGVEAVVEASRGEIDNVVAYPVVGTQRWRALFDLTANGSEPVNLRMFLRHRGNALSETWVYQFFPGLLRDT